jgi:hypothetical protein
MKTPTTTTITTHDTRTPVLSRHASDRAVKRGIRPEHISLCLDHAEPRDRRGATFYLLRGRDLPDSRGQVNAAQGTTLVVCERTILTVYKSTRKDRLGRPRARMAERCTMRGER